METLPYIQTADAKPFMKAADEKTCFLPLQDADPVVYKLVRVDGDGRLIPATDDEILEVEDLLEDDKDELHHDEDIGFLRGEVVTDQASSRNDGIDALEDSQSLGVNGEKLKVLHGAGGHSSSWNERSPAANKEHISDCFGSNSKDGSNACQRSVSDCSHELNRMDDIGQSASDNTIVTDDDLSLENLSLKELQETFKSTFGRETFVKDKVWLKRRIAMGLTNTYDIPTTDFLIRGKTIIVQDVPKASLPDDTSVVLSDICGAMLDSMDKLENKDILTDTSFVNGDMKHEELQNQEVCTADVVSKRVRKPTKRYIEELSDVETRECSGRSISTTTTSGQISSRKSHVNSAPANHSARHDPFAGYRFQIPHVSRVRRGRPRQDYMVFRNHQSDRLAVKDTVDVQSSQNKDHIESKICSEAYSDRIQHAAGGHPDCVMDSKQLVPVALTSEFQDGADIDNGELLGDGHMNGDIATVPTAKGGMRRKHHRAWSLSEVVKLVDGVARYGAGRWSEIKRVAFPSYTYRTSVDLKDKWRNLLKASNSQESSGGSQVQNSRKQTSIPIPAHILIRVRELAARHAQTQSKPKLGVAQTNISSGNHQEIKLDTVDIG